MNQTMDGKSENTCFNRWHNGHLPGQGSFILALFNAYIAASNNNREKLQQAFPEEFINEYQWK